LTAPALASDKDALEALDRLSPRLLAVRKTGDVCFHDGQTIRLDGLEITIVRQQMRPDSIFTGQKEEGRAVVSVGSAFDFEDGETLLHVSNALKVIARKNAPSILLPRARELAAMHGCHPSGWQISSGCRILGQCDANGIIKLSYMNMFLPQELRDYVICHELAHLSELNHSARFHKVCDTYLGGREKELVAKLKSFRWPLVRKN
ncbi:MAG: M48 family metallopeptidase, partial [Muribaculaceae bacterium]|nr:M48 family metallopeptidase [Muribaculaceae bacterium]